MKLTDKEIKRLERIKVKPFFPPPNESLNTSWEITIHDAKKEPLRWEEHKYLSDKTFSKKGLSSVGKKRGVDVNRFPTFFVEARSTKKEDNNKLIGGIRIQLSDKNGILPVIDELQGYTDTKKITDFFALYKNKRVAYGSGLWISPKYNFPGLSSDLGRAYFLLFHISKAHFHTACAPYHILSAWDSIGLSLLQRIPGFSYPDKRFRSFILFGNKENCPTPLLKWAEEQAPNFNLRKLRKNNKLKPMRTIENDNK